jgi:ADP-ribose pyrophosphatase YjhB (NUDIX family)
MTTYFATNPTEVRLSVSAVVRAQGGGRDILLMKRSDNGHWGLPGGFVEVGESVADATAREVLEETGYQVEVGRLIGVYSDPARQVVRYAEDRRVHAVNLCFECVATEKGEATTPEETLDTGFFPQDALPEPFVPIHGVRVEDATSGGHEARVR